MAISLQFRGGDLKSSEANSVRQWLTRSNKISFVEWCPTGIKTGITAEPIANLEDGSDNDTQAQERTLTMIGNNTGVSRTFEVTTKKYDKMYSQRAYVHWFVGEGMEEGVFSE